MKCTETPQAHEEQRISGKEVVYEEKQNGILIPKPVTIELGSKDTHVEEVQGYTSQQAIMQDGILMVQQLRTELDTQVITKELEEKLTTSGKDLDEESIAQNFQIIAKQGDLSPRVFDKGKSAGRGKKKQQKDTSIGQKGGIQTRRNLSKSHN